MQPPFRQDATKGRAAQDPVTLLRMLRTYGVAGANRIFEGDALRIMLGEPGRWRYSLRDGLIATPSAFALRSIVATYVPKCAAISDRLAPLFAIKISLRSSFHVNRPGVCQP